MKVAETRKIRYKRKPLRCRIISERCKIVRLNACHKPIITSGLTWNFYASSRFDTLKRNLNYLWVNHIQTGYRLVLRVDFYSGQTKFGSDFNLKLHATEFFSGILIIKIENATIRESHSR